MSACTPASVNGYNYIPWIKTIFGQCVYTPQEQISFGLGLSSTIIFLIAQFPQLFKNCVRRSTVGLSFGFLALWAIGDITNLIGSILTGGLITQKIQATYFIIVDFTLIFQHFLFGVIKKIFSKCFKFVKRKLINPHLKKLFPDLFKRKIKNNQVVIDNLFHQNNSSEMDELSFSSSENTEEGDTLSQKGQTPKTPKTPKTPTSPRSKTSFPRFPQSQIRIKIDKDYNASNKIRIKIDKIEKVIRRKIHNNNNSNNNINGGNNGNENENENKNENKKKSTFETAFSPLSPESPRSKKKVNFQFPSINDNNNNNNQLNNNIQNKDSEVKEIDDFFNKDPISDEIEMEEKNLENNNNNNNISNNNNLEIKINSKTILLLLISSIFIFSIFKSFSYTTSTPSSIINNNINDNDNIEILKNPNFGRKLNSLNNNKFLRIKRATEQFLVGWSEWVGYIIGIISGILYIGSRIPQIWTNFYRRSTDGISVLLFLFILTGNIVYILSLVVYSFHPLYLLKQAPWWLANVICVMLDIVIFFQWLFYTHIRTNKYYKKIFKPSPSRDELDRIKKKMKLKNKLKSFNEGENGDKKNKNKNKNKNKKNPLEKDNKNENNDIRESKEFEIFIDDDEEEKEILIDVDQYQNNEELILDDDRIKYEEENQNKEENEIEIENKEENQNKEEIKTK